MSVQFRAGSSLYQDSYIRSIARMQEVDGQWELSMLLVNMLQKYPLAEDAAMLAKMDIDHALEQIQTAHTYPTVDHALVALGYEKYESNK